MAETTVAAAGVEAKHGRKAAKVRGVYAHPTRKDVWCIHYTDAGGRRRREVAGTKGMAVALLSKRKTEAIQGRKLPESLRSKPVTFAEIAASGLEWSKAHKASWRGDVCRLEAVCSILGARPACEITPQELERAIRKLADDQVWAPATFNRVKNVVSMTYRLAVNNGQVASNPARLIRQLRSENARLRFLSLDEEGKLRAVIARECPQHMQEFDVAVNTGMRASEQYGLDWRDVDLEKRQVRLGQTKNGRERFIRLNQPAYDAFLSLRRRSTGAGPVFINAVTPGRYHGKPRASARNWFNYCVRSAGIEHIVWHGLRHTFCSRLVMAGVDLATVGQLAGHRTIQTTMRYSHLSPEHQQDALDRLARFAQPAATAAAREAVGLQ